jgi:hypothetical protein
MILFGIAKLWLYIYVVHSNQSDKRKSMLISILIPVIYYRISTSCQVLHLSVECVTAAIFLSHQKFGVENVRKVFVQNALNTTV